MITITINAADGREAAQEIVALVGTMILLSGQRPQPAPDPAQQATPPVQQATPAATSLDQLRTACAKAVNSKRLTREQVVSILQKYGGAAAEVIAAGNGATALAEIGA